MGKIIDDRFRNAHTIIGIGKQRFYKTNLYDPLERIKTGTTKIKLWDKLNDKKKISSWFKRMQTARIKGGNIDFSLEWTKKKSFLKAEKALEKYVSSPFDFNKKLIDSDIIPFIKECEFEELKSDMGAIK